ncbi:MAG: phosphatidylglycerophosphatase A family protein [Candidatus Aminicenantales bacterium]
MKIIAGVFATFFGAGFFPIAPGTFASMEAALVYRFAGWKLAPLPYQLVLLGLFLAGVAAAEIQARVMGQKDPRPVVIDEVVGQGIALFLAPAGWGWIAGGFFLFRLFDVFKPGPIRLLERLPGGWGIMADDVLAGVFSALVLQGLRLIL